MRFNEFKVTLTEGLAKGQQADEPSFLEPGYFTVGDSHSNGVSNYGRGKTWKALGQDGASAFMSWHLSQIKKIPKGSVVAISLGANDVGKPVQSVVSQVQSVISAAEQQGLTVVYLLPTTAKVEKKPGDIQKREELRTALSSAINVSTIDLGVATAPDGVHHQSGVYSNFARQIASEQSVKSGGSKLGTPEQTPGAPTTKDRISNSSNLEQGPPFPADQVDDVKKMQNGLQELGYSVGRFGVDGKYGPATAAAVTAFKKDYKLDGSGSAFSDKAFNMLSQIDSGQVARVKELTKVNDFSNASNIDTSTIQDPDFNKKLEKVASELGVSSKDLMAIFKQESGVNPQAVNRTSGATGLIQFMPTTARNLGTTTDALGKMDGVEQLDYVYKYFKSVGVTPGMKLGDLYMAVFMPAHVGKPDDTILGQNGASGFSGKVYAQNRGLDTNRDGAITVADVKSSVQRFA